MRFIDPWGLVKIKVNGNEVDAIDMDDGKLWANPIELAKAAGFTISNIDSFIRIAYGENYVDLQGYRRNDATDPGSTIFWTKSATYFTSVDNQDYTGILPVQGSMVDAKAFIMHLNCSLLGAIDWGEGNGKWNYGFTKDDNIAYYVFNPKTEKIKLSLGTKYGLESVKSIYDAHKPKFIVNAGFCGPASDSVGWTYLTGEGIYHNYSVTREGEPTGNFYTLFYYKDGSSKIKQTAKITNENTGNLVFAITGTTKNTDSHNAYGAVARTVIGTDSSGNVILWISETGYSTKKAVEAVEALGFTNVINLDGGGSTQYRNSDGSVFEGTDEYPRHIGSVFEIY